MYVAWTLLLIAVLALAWLALELAVVRQERDRLKMRNDAYERPNDFATVEVPAVKLFTITEEATQP